MNNTQVKADLLSAEKDIAEIMDNLYLKYHLPVSVSGDTIVNTISTVGGHLAAETAEHNVTIELSTK